MSLADLYDLIPLRVAVYVLIGLGLLYAGLLWRGELKQLLGRRRRQVEIDRKLPKDPPASGGAKPPEGYVRGHHRITKSRDHAPTAAEYCEACRKRPCSLLDLPYRDQEAL